MTPHRATDLQMSDAINPLLRNTLTYKSKKQRKTNGKLAFPLVIALLLILAACKKDESPVQVSPIDQIFTGVWYASAEMVGFEVLSDGTSRTLTVDTAGRLQYAKPEDGIRGNLTLVITEAKNGNMKANATFKGYDTTYTLLCVYTFSDNNNTVSITFLSPLNGQSTTMIFRRSAIGEVVKPKSSAAIFHRLKP